MNYIKTRFHLKGEWKGKTLLLPNQPSHIKWCVSNPYIYLCSGLKIKSKLFIPHREFIFVTNLLSGWAFCRLTSWMKKFFFCFYRLRKVYKIHCFTQTIVDFIGSIGIDSVINVMSMCMERVNNLCSQRIKKLIWKWYWMEKQSVRFVLWIIMIRMTTWGWST